MQEHHPLSIKRRISRSYYIPTLRLLSTIVGTVVRLRAAGHKVILVISARRSALATMDGISTSPPEMAETDLLRCRKSVGYCYRVG